MVLWYKNMEVYSLLVATIVGLAVGYLAYFFINKTDQAVVIGVVAGLAALLLTVTYPKRTPAKTAGVGSGIAAALAPVSPTADQPSNAETLQNPGGVRVDALDGTVTDAQGNNLGYRLKHSKYGGTSVQPAINDRIFRASTESEMGSNEAPAPYPPYDQ
ncbi:MAG: hypothetical protein ACYCOU_02790 [Sulfobacillus sp.]